MAALALVAIGLCERLPWPRRAPAGLLAVAGLWSASGLAPLIAVNSHFVYYAYYPAAGLALAAVTLLARLGRPRWTRLQAVRAGAAVLLAAVLAAGAGAKHDGAQHDTHSIRRANRYLAGFKRDLLRQHPAFPEGARCFFWNVPYFIGFQLADGPALRVWYDDLTLEGRFIREYTPDRTRPTFFFVHDHAGHLVEVTPGYPDPDLAHPPAEYSDAHAHLAYWLSRVGEMDRAILECRKALEVEPDHRAATANLGIFLVETGAPDEGAPALERAIRLDPDMAELRFYLGAAYARLARLGEAERELAAFVRMAPASPNRPIAVKFLEQIRRDLGQPGRER
jgi:tetratricopeptide (TPR) repeat protein